MLPKYHFICNIIYYNSESTLKRNVEKKVQFQALLSLVPAVTWRDPLKSVHQTTHLLNLSALMWMEECLPLCPLKSSSISFVSPVSLLSVLRPNSPNFRPIWGQHQNGQQRAEDTSQWVRRYWGHDIAYSHHIWPFGHKVGDSVADRVLWSQTSGLLDQFHEDGGNDCWAVIYWGHWLVLTTLMFGLRVKTWF